MSLFENISDTAKAVAIYRAEESERPDAAFHDPFARKLAGEKGQQMALSIEYFKTNSWLFVARTFEIDEFIMGQVEEGYDTVINLAAGLDARPYRMDLPSSLQWIEVDLPGIIEEKKKILDNETPKCELRRIQLDLTDQKARVELFKKLNRQADKALIISEGLIIYLTEEQVGSLATDLSSQKNFKRWGLDMVSPALLAILRERIGSALDQSNSKFQFAPEDGENFFLQYGWKPLEAKSAIKTAARLNRLPKELLTVADAPEPAGPKRKYPWPGICLFENING
jgi:methyltransferase (TIGR00027 family)